MTGKPNPSVKMASKQQNSPTDWYSELDLDNPVDVFLNAIAVGVVLNGAEENWTVCLDTTFPRVVGSHNTVFSKGKLPQVHWQILPESFAWGLVEEEGKKLEPSQGMAMTFCPFFCSSTFFGKQGTKFPFF